MIVHGYDTDDLTNRQNYIYHKLGNSLNGFSFLKSCIQKNFREKKWDNYDGDCDYLFNHFSEEELKSCGIDVDNLYE